MMNKNYFYLSEIILGLRDEYNKTVKELEKLRKFTKSVLNNDIDSIGIYSNFDMDSTNRELENQKRYLIIKLKETKKLLKIINSLTNKNVYKQEISRDLNYVTNAIKIYGINNLTIDDAHLLYKKCDDVLHTTIGLYSNDSYKKIEDEHMKVKVGHGGVFSLTDNTKKYAPNTGFDYYANIDQLVLNNYYDNDLFIDGVREIMNTPIPKKIVNSKLASIIENNPKSSLPITFEGLTNTEDTQFFDLVEEPNKVIALRVR